jgi:hypothetical protein
MRGSGSNMGDSQSGYQEDPNYSRQNNTNPHPVSRGGNDDDPARLGTQGTPTAYPDQRGYRHDPISTEDKENSLPETVTLSTEPIDVQSKLDGTNSQDWDATGDDQNNQSGGNRQREQQNRGNTPYQNQQGNNQRYQSSQPSGDSQSGLRSDDLERGINAGPDVMPPGGRSGFESGSNRTSGNSGGQSGLRSDDLERGINAGPDVMPPGGTSGFDSPSRNPQSGKELFDSPNRNNQTSGGVQAYDSHVQRRPDTTIRNDYEASNQRADMMDTTLRQDKDLTYMSGGTGNMQQGNTQMSGSQMRQAGVIRPATKSAPSINDSHYETGTAGYVVDNRSNSLDGDDQGYNRIQGGTANEHHPGSRDRA